MRIVRARGAALKGCDGNNRNSLNPCQRVDRLLLLPATSRRAHYCAQVDFFRLGQCLLTQGNSAETQHYFIIAEKLCPERWHFVRQALEMIGVGNASGPEFFAAVDALGVRPYSAPMEFTEKSH